MHSLLHWLTDTDAGSNCMTALVLVASFLLGWSMWRSPIWGPGLRRLMRNRVALLCMAILSIYVFFAVLDSVRWQGPHEVTARSLMNRWLSRAPERTYSAPEARHEIGQRAPKLVKEKHLLGTDALGNDVLYEMLRGCRTALIVGTFTLVLSIPFAVIFGIVAGYFGGILDDVVQYIYITLASIPDILLLATLMMMLGKGLWQICVALGITAWVGLCRLLRGETMKHREKEYVLAARAMGVHPLRILQKHIFPNVFHLVIISATLSFSGLVLSETVLSYLGLGVPPGVGSWGMMINAARLELAREPIVWWTLTAASAALLVLVLAANILGDAVRDAFDPRLKGI